MFTARANGPKIFNSDSKDFWGTGDVFNPEIRAELVDKPSKCYKLTINLPALAAIVLR
jgi:1,4-alpha-glucan branching enzyme